MNNRSVAVALLGVSLGSVAVAGTLPAGLLLSARVSAVEGNVVRVEMIEPVQMRTPWDHIASKMKGCTAKGVATTRGSRSGIQVDSLLCAGKKPIAVKAVAISPVDKFAGLPGPVTVGAEVSVLLMASAQTL